MAHDPSVGFADYFSAAAADATGMEEGAPELFGLQAADMEFLGPDGGGATMRFLSAGGQQQQQPIHQAPLSLSLCRPDDGGGVGVALEDHLGGGGSSRHHHQQPAAWMMMMQQQQHDYSAAPQPQHPAAAAWHLRSSRFLLPAQQLLQEFCSLPLDDSAAASSSKRAKQAKAPPSSSSSQAQQQQKQEDGEGSSSSPSWAPSPQIQAMEAVELQRLKDKLYIMLEEVDRRYRRYCEQMRALAGGFEAVAGDRAAAPYTALASRTISRHFRSLRDGVVAQLQAARRALGEKDVAVPGMTRGDTPRLRVLDQCIRQQKALSQAGGMMESHPWRPQRGLPERAVTILRAWLFEHFLHPYPSDVDKHILSRQTGLSRSQVSNWFINARVRLWKPMVEEMYLEEMKADGSQQDDGAGGGLQQQRSKDPNKNNPSSSHASGAHEEDGGGDDSGGGVDRKPTRAQLLQHDAGSLASVVNIGAASRARLDNFGIVMDHLDFDASPYGHQQGGFGGGGVSLTLGLQQHDSHDGGGVNIAFGAPAHHGGAPAGYLQFAAAAGQHHPMGGHHHVHQFGAAGGIDGEATTHGQQAEHYRSLAGAGFHLLRDLAG